MQAAAEGNSCMLILLSNVESEHGLSVKAFQQFQSVNKTLLSDLSL